MKYLIGLLLLIGFLSCQKTAPKFDNINAKDLSVEQIDSILEKFNFEYETPIVIDSTNQILIPISTEFINKREKYSSDGYSSGSFPRYWNILFYNRETGETQLLSKNKIRINEIFVKPDQYQGRKQLLNKRILYSISYLDYNQDNKLDSDDPDFLFVSEINGNNLKRISPEREDLLYFEVIPNSPQILLRTLRDVNQDSLFNRKDESIWYKAELINDNWELKEIIDSANRKTIENLYFEQWLK